MKVVLDTNVLVSGTFWRGASSKILEMADRGELEIILSKELIDEYYSVINREEIMNKIANKNLILNKAVCKIIKESKIVEPLEKLNIVTEDSDDNVILECAVEGNVNCIISQDNHLLKLKEFKGIKIITPEEFLRRFSNHQYFS